MEGSHRLVDGARRYSVPYYRVIWDLWPCCRSPNHYLCSQRVESVIKLKCTCGKTLKVKAEYAGRRLKCPSCQATVTVPKAGTAATGTAKPTPQLAGSKPSAKPKRKRKPAPPPVRDDAPSDFEEMEEVEDDDFGVDEYGAYDDQPAALPSRRKKKKGKAKTKKEQPVSDSPEAIPPKVMYALYGLAGTVSAVIMFFIVSSIIAAGRADTASQALPENFEVFTHDHGGLTSEYPTDDGWVKESGGGTGGVPPWVRYKNADQDVKIQIRGSVSGTSVGDIAAAPGGMIGGLGEELPDELDPVVAVHNWQREKMSSEYNSYEETEPVKIETGFGTGRICDFTGGSALSTDYGVRASMIANQYQYNVICTAPQKRLEEYRPVFERIIQSVGR